MSTFNVEAGDKLYIQDVTLRDGMERDASSGAFSAGGGAITWQL